VTAPDRRHGVFEQLYATLDWIAAGLARVVGSGDAPGRLARPMVGVALLGGLAADAIGAVGTGERALGLVAVTLTLCGSGALWLVVGRFRPGRASGGTRSMGAAVLEDWLRRLQAAFAVVLVIVGGLALAGAAGASAALFVRNVAESVRVSGVVLAISYALMDHDPGLPAWLTSRARGGAGGQVAGTEPGPFPNRCSS
jgi:hypothetical protein